MYPVRGPGPLCDTHSQVCTPYPGMYPVRGPGPLCDTHSQVCTSYPGMYPVRGPGALPYILHLKQASSRRLLLKPFRRHKMADIDAWPLINTWWSKGQRKLTEDGGGGRGGGLEFGCGIDTWPAQKHYLC